MLGFESIPTTLATIGVAMTLLAGLELAIPLRARGRWSRAHLAPNLALTASTLLVNAGLGAALALALAALEARGLGLLAGVPLPGWAGLAVSLLALDLSFYASHVAMHQLPGLWRFHRVHHSDPSVDVTTTLRQHPGESVIRYVFLAAFAIPLGVGPADFVVYRSAVALVALLEHANLRAPLWLDRLLSLALTFPTFHKVHHAREPRLTDSNYGNLVSWWDRLFGTFTPAAVGRSVAYGLDGFDTPSQQTTPALLALPFRAERRRDGPAVSPGSALHPAPVARDPVGARR